MKSKILTKIICAAVCCSTLFATGCGDGAGGKATLDFMYTGTQEILELFSGMIREYNNTQGDVDNVKVMGMPVNSGGIDGKLSNVLPSSNGPDVVIGSDEYFKKHTRNMTDLTGLFSDNVFAGLYKDQESRYHYDIQNTTSNADDALYGLPAVNDPTVLYYNKTALEAAGVVCISVDAKDIAAFNAGTLADYNGKKKADYGLTVDIPAKGYFRSNNPYYCDGSDFSGSLWRYPTTDYDGENDPNITIDGKLDESVWTDKKWFANHFYADLNNTMPAFSVTAFTTEYGVYMGVTDKCVFITYPKRRKNY